MRLEKYLVLCGVLSRRKIKKAILEGRVTVNSTIELDDSRDIDEKNDIITFDGKIPNFKILKYYIMNKPAGYITAMEDKNKKTVADLLPNYIDKKSVFPVGRLDKDTEGVLLFTNDGQLSYNMTYPNKKLEKIYFVELDREILESDIKKLEAGIILDTGYKALPCKVQLLSKKAINITVIEGKYHQIKKMLKAVNNKVTYLKRVQFGNLRADNIKLGEIKEIIRDDILI